MGIYTGFSSNANDTEEVTVNLDELTEAFLYDELSSCTDEEKKAIFESAECMAMLEAQKFKTKTIVRLNKNDDISRRTTMAALQLAKEHNDPLWTALKQNRIKERKLLAAIEKKYASQATRVAKAGQKEYINGTNKTKLLKTADLNNRK